MKEPPDISRSAGRIPSWAKRSLRLRDLHPTRKCLRESCLATVCEEARCPNIAECFSRPTATFLILGRSCTRRCRFCAVDKGHPSPPDPGEAGRIACMAAAMGLRHVVITSVSRDDLPDRGAGAFARAVREVRKALPGSTVEVLTPDFSGREDLLELVLNEKPDVFNHNIETVGRLYETIRPQASLETSLRILRAAREYSLDLVVKSGLVLGLGEQEEEISETLASLSWAGCDLVTMGQYLQPTRAQVPVSRYWLPEDFERFSDIAKNAGIRYVLSGPLVRSSYRAREALEDIRRDRRRYGIDTGRDE
jgi:lipoic acid synthetase